MVRPGVATALHWFSIFVLLCPAVAWAGNVVLDTPPAYDPELGGAAVARFHLRYDGLTAADVSVNVLDGSGGLASHAYDQRVSPGVDVYFDWNGTDAAGKVLDPGAYTVRAEAVTPGGIEVQENALRLVRLGLVRIKLEAGSAGAKYQVVYHRVSPGTPTPWPLPASEAEWRSDKQSAMDLADLDDNQGKPRPSPAPWAQLGSPPIVGGRLVKGSRNLPACFRAGSPVIAEVLVGQDAVSHAGRVTGAGYPVNNLAIRLAGPNGKVSGTIAPGDTAKVDLPPARAAVGREDRTVAWKFQAEIASGVWTDLPGEIKTQHVIYTVLDAPPRHLSMSGPWLAVLDDAARWADGLSSPDEALAAVTAGVHNDLGLRYETVAGIPYYTYGPLADTTLEMDAFLARSWGSRVNCTDCAGLVTAYGGVLGIDVEMFAVGYGFYINFIRPIGMPAFTMDPFGLGGPGGFQVHTAATRDKATHVFDATLAVDDDGHPGFAPHKAVLPLGLGFARYIQDLTPQAIPIQVRTRVKVR